MKFLLPIIVIGLASCVTELNSQEVKPTRPSVHGKKGHEIEISIGGKVPELSTWFTKNDIQMGATMYQKSIGVKMLTFHIPADSLTFQVSYSVKTNVVEKIGVIVKNEGRSRIRTDARKITFHEDSSYSLRMLPVTRRPIAIQSGDPRDSDLVPLGPDGATKPNVSQFE